MPCMIHNPSVEPVSLPYPFRGTLGGGARIVLNMTAAAIDAVLPRQGSGLRVLDMPDGYTGPFDSTYEGGASNATDTALVAAVNQTTVATNTAERRADAVRVEAPIAADLVTIVNAVDAANGAQAIAAQPDVPRKLQVRVVDGDSSISAGVITLIGVGARGQALTQAIPLTGGTQTVTTADAYARLTSATITALVGAVAGDTIGIGPATALGLPGTQVPVPTSFVVYKSNVDNANEAVGTVDGTAGTIVPTTVPNGAHTYDFWYTYAVAVLQATHNHTQDTHGHAVL